MSKYDYQVVAPIVEKYGAGINKTKVAQELNITRVTLNRWITRYYSDLQAHRGRYGDVMINMWRDGLPMDKAEEFIKKNSEYDMFLCENAFMVPYYFAADIYSAEWYKDLTPTNWYKRVHDKRESKIQRIYAQLGTAYKKQEYKD